LKARGRLAVSRVMIEKKAELPAQELKIFGGFQTAAFVISQKKNP